MMYVPVYVYEPIHICEFEYKYTHTISNQLGLAEPAFADIAINLQANINDRLRTAVYYYYYYTLTGRSTQSQGYVRQIIKYTYK